MSIGCLPMGRLPSYGATVRGELGQLVALIKEVVKEKF
jgi:hypothetical protein